MEQHLVIRKQNKGERGRKKDRIWRDEILRKGGRRTAEVRERLVVRKGLNIDA